MQLGMVGLGKMGANMTVRLSQDEHEIVAFDVSEEARAKVTDRAANASAADSLKDLVGKLKAPRAVWIMVPAGEITQQTIDELGGLLDQDDVIIDGGNSKYTEAIEHARALRQKGIHFVDAGTSGGVWG
ncbi:MAG: NAD(P)-binding domain-containing protein, partial [Actinomycetota bacterium]